MFIFQGCFTAGIPISLAVFSHAGQLQFLVSIYLVTNYTQSSINTGSDSDIHKYFFFTLYVFSERWMEIVHLRDGNC